MTARPRIAWVEEWMSWRAANVLPALAEELDVTYVTTGQQVPQARFAEVIRLPAWSVMQVAGFALSRVVDRLFAEGRIDLALGYASILFAVRRTPYVTLEGGSVYKEIRIFSSREPWWKRLRYLTGFLHYAVPEMLCIRRARHVIANSHSLKHDLVELHGLSADGVSVAYNGIGAEYLEIFRERQRHDARRLLYVGRLHVRKGIVPLLREFAARKDLDLEIRVAGDGPDRETAETIARTDSRIRILGEIDRDRLRELLATSGTFLFPTWLEGFSSALAEAMAAGLACVSYDIPVVRELLDDAGLLVPLGEPSAMLDAAATLAREPERARELGRRANQRARRFSWDECAGRIASVLREQIEGAAGDTPVGGARRRS